MSNVRASKIIKLVLNEQINQNSEVTVDDNFGNGKFYWFVLYYIYFTCLYCVVRI